MKRSNFEQLEDGTYYGEIAGFNGVWANCETIERCREKLQEVLEEWILLKLRKNLYIPTIKHYDLNNVLCEK